MRRSRAGALLCRLAPLETVPVDARLTPPHGTVHPLWSRISRSRPPIRPQLPDGLHPQLPAPPLGRARARAPRVPPRLPRAPPPLGPAPPHPALPCPALPRPALGRPALGRPALPPPLPRHPAPGLLPPRLILLLPLTLSPLRGPRLALPHPHLTTPLVS
nr:hypothetical protein CFP56_79364 [Quercus suber]